MAVFGSGDSESRYAQEYSQNRAAIAKLAQAIREHPMNRLPEIDGQSMDRLTYVRRLAQETEAALALLDKEEEILGHMAKLVALDAMALDDRLADARVAADGGIDPARPVSVSGAADLFLN